MNSLMGYPKNAATFIKETIGYLDEKFSRENYALFIFGSMVKKDYTRGTKGTSDVDLLVVLNENIEKKEITRAWNHINAIEIRIFSPKKKWGIIPRILRAVECQTGMHNNLFITTLADLKSLDFSRIFHTNKILTNLIAPNNIVLGSALTKITLLHGKKELAEKLGPIKKNLEKKGISSFQLLKSLLMDAVLSFCSIILLPVTKDATRYSIEATKWSLYSTTYALTRERPSKGLQAKFYKKLGVSPRFLNLWVRLSRSYTRDARFSVQAFFTSFQVHILGLKLLEK